MKKHKKRKTQFIYEHISNNAREYASVIIIFLIGIVIGVISLNNIDNIQKEEVQNYITQFTSTISENKDIDKIYLLKNIAINNLILVVLLIILGSTIIGAPLVYAIIGYKGFCLSFTISSIIAVLGNTKGIIFVISTILLQNIIYIPCIIALAVSGIRLYKSIVKEKKRENIKIEVLRHIIFSTLIALIILLGSVIEAYVSTNILLMFNDYFCM